MGKFSFINTFILLGHFESYLALLLAPRPGGGPTVEARVTLFFEFLSWYIVLFCAAAAAANCPALVLGNLDVTPLVPLAPTTTTTKSRHHGAPLMVLESEGTHTL